MITSSSNPSIKNLVKLQKNAKERKEQGLFLVEGFKMVEEALKKKLVHKLFVSKHFQEQLQKQELLSCTEYEVVEDSVFKSISGTVTPQGILALVRMPVYQIDQLLQEEQVTVLLLEDIQDPGNLGTMIRTAEGAGITAVVMSKATVDIFNPKVIRSTMGSIFRVPFVYVDDFSATLKQLQEKRISLYAADLQGVHNYQDEIYDQRAGILIGNEARGLRKESIDTVDCRIKISMAGELESLNAAIAAALLMYEVKRRHL